MVERDFARELLEAVIAMVLLGATVAGLHLLIMGNLPWTFFIGELVGLGMGAGLLVAAGPRRSRP
jgi:hypothetical protein